MALSLNKPKLDNLAGEIWKSAERLRRKFNAYEYQNVMDYRKSLIHECVTGRRRISEEDLKLAGALA